MSTEDKVAQELAIDRLERTVTVLHEAAAGVTAVNADAIVLEAERQTVMDILIGAGLCTKTTYCTMMADSLSESIAGLAESNLIDIQAVSDVDDGVAGE